MAITLRDNSGVRSFEREQEVLGAAAEIVGAIVVFLIAV